MSETQALQQPQFADVLKSAWNSGSTDTERTTRLLDMWFSFMYKHVETLPHRYTPGYILQNRFSLADHVRQSNLFSKDRTTHWFAGTALACPVRMAEPPDRLNAIIALEGLWGCVLISERDFVWHHIALEFRQKRDWQEISGFKWTVHETKDYASVLAKNRPSTFDLLFSLNALVREWHERRVVRAAESEIISESLRNALTTSSRW